MRTLILLLLTTNFLQAQEREFDFSIDIEEFRNASKINLLMRYLVVLFLFINQAVSAQPADVSASFSTDDLRRVLSEVIDSEEAKHFKKVDLNDGILLVLQADFRSPYEQTRSKVLFEFLNDPNLDTFTEVQVIEEQELAARGREAAFDATQLWFQQTPKNDVFIHLTTSNISERKSYSLRVFVQEENEEWTISGKDLNIQRI